MYSTIRLRSHRGIVCYQHDCKSLLLIRLAQEPYNLLSHLLIQVAATIGEARVQAIQLNNLVDRVKILIKANPPALLCQRRDCPRCNAVQG